MKIPNRILASLILLCVLCGSTLSAQSTFPPAGAPALPNPPTDPSSFFGVAQSWMTSFNTNNLWTASKFEIASGVDSIQGAGVNLANSFRVSYGVWKSLSLESVTRNTGISGTVLSQQGGLGLNFPINDVKFTVYADGGYYFPAENKRLFAEVGVRITKLMTKYTAIGVGIGNQLPANRQVYQAFFSIPW